jgi:hypothetical protein
MLAALNDLVTHRGRYSSTFTLCTRMIFVEVTFREQIAPDNVLT